MQDALQELLVQSLFDEQPLPLPHGPHTEPPQSTSVSLPSFFLSAQAFPH